MNRRCIMGSLTALALSTAACNDEGKPEGPAAPKPPSDVGSAAALDPVPTSTASAVADPRKLEVELAAGKTPFSYPAVSLDAKAGQYALAPSASFITKAMARGGDKSTFIFYGGWIKEPGDKASKIETLTKKVDTIPNAMIIPIEGGKTAKPGEVVLTSWASGSGMQRAIVVAGGKAPKVRYLDIDYDNPSGWGKKDDQLEPNTFHALTEPGEVGTTVACKDGTRFKRWIVVHQEDDRILGVGFAGRMKVLDASSCQALPVQPKLEAGNEVWVPVIGNFNEGTVTKVDAEIGRAWVEYSWGNEKKQKAFGFTNIAPEL